LVGRHDLVVSCEPDHRVGEFGGIAALLAVHGGEELELRSVAGDLDLPFESFPMAGGASLSLLTYTAEPGSPSEDALTPRQLGGNHTSESVAPATA
jgi:hypothetical protein